MTRAWGLEVDRVELAVEAVLQPPQDSLAVPSLDSTLQQLALHLLGGSMNSAVGRVPGPGKGRGMLFSFSPFDLADTVYLISRGEQSEGLEKSPSVQGSLCEKKPESCKSSLKEGGVLQARVAQTRGFGLFCWESRDSF